MHFFHLADLNILLIFFIINQKKGESLTVDLSS